ncbi:hypothetical protein [Streptobacillus moniliformis]|uniref:hypothetical protein n=1 Tax=Streptobacillus moniliformis TaxID=34105 RepID=UPI0007E4B9C7|nr:hypothetical protein [Streptobacillus moniliformis]QXW65800.1 hypothetical protein KX935_00575 [Streptobacillus moniliformis]
MKKIILVLLIGITSFSAPITRQINRRVNEVKKVEEIKEVKPKRIFKIKKPRYRVGMEISTLPIYHTKTKMFGYYAYKSFSFLPEWKIEINENFDITLGPKVSANLVFGVNNRDLITNDQYSTQSIIDKSTIIISASIGGEIDFNYRLRDNLKAYVGLETQIGIGEKIYTKSGLYDTGEKKEGQIENTFKPYTPYQIFKNTYLTYTGKVSAGLKIREKYNIGIFFGYGKGYFGIEFGQTF